MPDEKDDKDFDSTPTPAASPEAKRRRSSQSVEALVKCPSCEGDARRECDFCINPTTKLNTRWVTREMADAWIAAHKPTPVVPKP
jgi:hypothetical protein